MDFNETIQGEQYSFSCIAQNLFLVSATTTQYLLYKTNSWKCADEVSKQLLEKLGTVIDERQRVMS
jgi:hypothetical protein